MEPAKPVADKAKEYLVRMKQKGPEKDRFGKTNPSYAFWELATDVGSLSGLLMTVHTFLQSQKGKQ